MRKVLLIVLLILGPLGCSWCRPEKEELKEPLFKICFNGKYGFINREGKVVIPPVFDDVKDFSEGLAAAEKDGKWGYINKKGIWVIKPKYADTDAFSEGLALVWYRSFICELFHHPGWSGYVDKNGKWIIKIPKGIMMPRSFSEGLARVFIGDKKPENEKTGYIDKTGRIKFTIEIPDELEQKLKHKDAAFPTFLVIDDAGDFSEGRAWFTVVEKCYHQGMLFESSKRYGFIDETGMIVVEPTFDEVSDFSEGLAVIVIGGKYGYIDRNGKIVINPQFGWAEEFSEGLAVVAVKGKEGYYRSGYIDRTGKLVIPPRFTLARRFSEGLAAVCVGPLLRGRKCGYIDKTGEMVIQPQFDNASDFSNGLAEVCIGDRRGYIDKTGKYIWKPTK